MVASTLLLVGCGTSRPTQAPASLRVGQNADITTLDPAIGYDVYSWPWERLLFETLLGYGDGTTLVPRLAESMPTLSDDDRTLTFTLRKGVNFVTADGNVLREVAADDFVYSLNRLLNPNLIPAVSPVAISFFGRIVGADDVIKGRADTASGISAPDARTLVITLTGPDPSLPYELATPFGSVVPREFGGADTTAFSAKPVGTGPYLLAEWVPGQHARFVKNPHYWNPAIGHAPEIDLHLGVDAESQLQQVETGTLDIMTDSIPAGEFNATITDSRWTSYIHRSLQFITNYLGMDTSSDGPLGNVLVRRAINRAIDRQNVIQLKNGRGVPATCIYPPLLPGYDPTCNPYPHDLTEARNLMTQAGFGSGFDTSLYSDEADPDRHVAQAIQQDLAQIGIHADLVPQPFLTLLNSVAIQHNTPLVVWGQVMDFPDPADFVEPTLTCGATSGVSNPAWYCNPSVDALVDQARQEPDNTRRLALFAEIQRQIMADAPWAPLDHSELVVLVRPAVDGFALHPVWRFDFERYSITP